MRDSMESKHEKSDLPQTSQERGSYQYLDRSGPRGGCATAFENAVVTDGYRNLVRFKSSAKDQNLDHEKGANR